MEEVRERELPGDVDERALVGFLAAAATRGYPFCEVPTTTPRADGMAGGELSEIPDKYRLPTLPQIDCESRLPLCRSRCCHLTFKLSRQDLEEGVVRWNPQRPFWNSRRADKSCVHLEAGRCTVYAHRPGVCRLYDCRRDRRIWLDFERRIAAP